MNQHPVVLLKPVFHFLDRMIHEHEDTFFMLFVYVAVPLIAWILGRRSGRRKTKARHTFILVIRPPAQPPALPPVIRWEFEPPSNDGNGPFGGLRWTQLACARPIRARAERGRLGNEIKRQ